MATEKYRKKMRFGPARTRGRLNPGTRFVGPHGSRRRVRPTYIYTDILGAINQSPWAERDDGIIFRGADYVRVNQTGSVKSNVNRDVYRDYTSGYFSSDKTFVFKWEWRLEQRSGTTTNTWSFVLIFNNITNPYTTPFWGVRCLHDNLNDRVSFRMTDSNSKYSTAPFQDISSLPVSFYLTWTFDNPGILLGSSGQQLDLYSDAERQNLIWSGGVSTFNNTPVGRWFSPFQTQLSFASGDVWEAYHDDFIGELVTL